MESAGGSQRGLSTPVSGQVPAKHSQRSLNNFLGELFMVQIHSSFIGTLKCGCDHSVNVFHKWVLFLYSWHVSSLTKKEKKKCYHVLHDAFPC